MIPKYQSARYSEVKPLIFHGFSKNAARIFWLNTFEKKRENLRIWSKKTCFYDFWASWRLLGRFGALLGPLLGLIFHFGLVKTEEVATGGLKSLGLAEKSAA